MTNTIALILITIAVAAAAAVSNDGEATTQPATEPFTQPAATQSTTQPADASSETADDSSEAGGEAAGDNATEASSEGDAPGEGADAIAAPVAIEGGGRSETIDDEQGGMAAGEPAPSDASPEVIDWLTKIEAATQQIEAMSGKITYDRIQGLLGDRQRRFGTLVYTAGPPARFAIHLDRLLIDGTVRPQDRWYVFDGRWLVERLDDEKRFTKWQVIPPNRDPAEADPLGTGEGPFALPVRVKKDDLLRRFNITLVEPAEGDPANSLHMKLIPREPVRYEFEELDLYYDRETLKPMQVRTLDDADSGDESIIKLRDLDTNAANVDESQINVDEPKERGWRVEVKPWEAAPTPAAN